VGGGAAEDADADAGVEALGEALAGGALTASSGWAADGEAFDEQAVIAVRATATTSDQDRDMLDDEQWAGHRSAPDESWAARDRTRLTLSS
jgi:hypothetical protein